MQMEITGEILNVLWLASSDCDGVKKHIQKHNAASPIGEIADALMTGVIP